MAPSLLVDGSNSHHDDVVDPFKGVPSFRYSVTQRGSSSIGPLLFPSLDSSLEVSRNGSLSSNDRRDQSEAADESKKSLKLGNDSDNDDCTLSSSLVIGGGAARTNVSSTNNIHNKSSEIHLTRGRHGKLPTKIRTKNEQRVNTMSTTNRRFSAPVTPIADLATGIEGEEMEDRVQSPAALRQRRGFSKYLKYDTKTAAAEAGKYKRRSDTSSAIAGISSSQPIVTSAGTLKISGSVVSSTCTITSAVIVLPQSSCAWNVMMWLGIHPPETVKS